MGYKLMDAVELMKTCGPKQTREQAVFTLKQDLYCQWHVKYWILSYTRFLVKKIQSDYEYRSINIISNLNMSVCQYWC